MSNKLLKNNAQKPTSASATNSSSNAILTSNVVNANSHNQNSRDELTTCNIALLGPTGSGKSALLVKYITRRFIGEYDPYYGKPAPFVWDLISRPSQQRVIKLLSF